MYPGDESFSVVICPTCQTKQTVPKKLGKFLLLSFLGQGGMGAVFLGYDPRLGRQVAIKVLGKVLDNPEAVTNFLREARVAAQINSPHVVQIYQVNEEHRQPFIVMELISGGQLDDRMEDHPLEEMEALEICRQAAQGLYAAQEIGLFHGDIKPENILFDQHGIAKIADFGLRSVSSGKGRKRIQAKYGEPHIILRRKKPDAFRRIIGRIFIVLVQRCFMF